MREQESLGKRLGRLGVLLGVVFALAAGVVVTQRLSSDALSLLLGLACGVGAMAPTLLLGAVLWRRQEERLREQRSAAPASAQPPVVVIAPPMLPGYGAQYPALPEQPLAWTPSRQERKFTMVGGEE